MNFSSSFVAGSRLDAQAHGLVSGHDYSFFFRLLPQLDQPLCMVVYEITFSDIAVVVSFVLFVLLKDLLQSASLVC